MHFRQQRLIFATTRHSHIDNRSPITHEIECQQREMVFSLTTPKSPSRIQLLDWKISGSYYTTVLRFPSDQLHDRQAGHCLIQLGPSLCISSDGISCYTWVNKHHGRGLSSLSCGWDKSHGYPSLWLSSSAPDELLRPNSKKRKTAKLPEYESKNQRLCFAAHGVVWNKNANAPCACWLDYVGGCWWRRIP